MRGGLCIYTSATRGPLTKERDVPFLSHECLDLLGGPEGGRRLATDSQKGANVGTNIKVPPAGEVQPSIALWNWREGSFLSHKKLKTSVTDLRSGWYWYRMRFWSESEAAENVSTSC